MGAGPAIEEPVMTCLGFYPGRLPLTVLFRGSDDLLVANPTHKVKRSISISL